ncbi:MAG: hypothetical protein RAP03_17595, partial [Candidatus Electryonea clarkiae]|nr:hypothetical protein [Candidatus Electryonea clarkiae]
MKFIGKIYLPVILFGSCFFCVLSFADIIRIPEDNNSIQDAIDDSESGDTILIAPGEYEVSLEIEDHGLTLASEYLFDEDTTIIQETILSGSNNFRVIRIDSLGEDSVSIIGLTIANGMNLHPTDTGAGIICNGTRINLISNIIRNNYALYDAGGQLENCSGNIRNNLIIENIAESSTGGFQFVNCQMLIEANRFINNHSNSLSGGLKGHSGNLCIRNNLFEGNIARVGGGLELSFGSHIIVNNVFRGNTAHTDAGNGGGLYLYGTNHDDDPQGLVLIRDNVFVENTAGSMGGGLSVEAFFAEVEISGNKFEENRSPQGGALLITTSCDLFDNTFKNNNSQRGSIFSTSSVNGTNPVIYCYNNIFLNNLPEDDFIPFISAAHTFSRGQIYISNCDFSGNLPAAVGYSRETNQGTITALNCYWGDPSGPFHAIENPDGLGDSVDCDMDEEDFMPFSRQPISAVYKLATPDNCAEVNESPVL